MIEFTGSNPTADPSPWTSVLKTTFILRAGAGVLLLVSHGWSGAWRAYEFLWEEQSWDWVPRLNEAGVPYPHLVAPALALAVAAIAISWCVGFLTRLFSLVFIPVLIAFIAAAQRAGSPLVETAWLYLLVAVTLLLFGSGAVSIDKLFHLGESWSSAPKKKKRR
jgi:uncharacterized membrane protein YphA (DoxX/SURF4 family)